MIFLHSYQFRCPPAAPRLCSQRRDQHHRLYCAPRERYFLYQESHNHFAVCMKRGKLIVDDVAREISRKVLYFLRHGGQSTCEVTGWRKRGNGLEVPYVYCFVAKQRLIKKLKTLLQPSDHSESLPILVVVLFVCFLYRLLYIPKK